jgi:hypothetical protein
MIDSNSFVSGKDVHHIHTKFNLVVDDTIKNSCIKVLNTHKNHEPWRKLALTLLPSVVTVGFCLNHHQPEQKKKKKRNVSWTRREEQTFRGQIENISNHTFKNYPTTKVVPEKMKQMSRYFRHCSATPNNVAAASYTALSI